MTSDILYDEYAKKLENEYRLAYDKIYIYSSVSLAIGDDLSFIMNEVVDILLSAQQDNRPIENVIGKNMRDFCDQLLAGHKLSRMKSFLNFFLSFWIIAIISATFISIDISIDYFENSPNIWSSTVYMGSFIAGICVGLVIGMLLRKIVATIAFTHSWYTRKAHTITTTLIFILLFICLLSSLSIVETWFAVPRWLFLPTIIIYSIAGYIYNKKEKKRIKKEELYMSFNDTMKVECLIQLQKKYLRYCKKCIKKEVASDTVSLWYEKKFKKEIKGYGYLKIWFIFIFFIASVGTMLTSTFVDSIIFAIILLCVEIPIYRFSCKGKNTQIKIHDLVHQKDTDIFDETLKDEL